MNMLKSIVSFYENLTGLTEETSKIVENVDKIKEKYYLFLKRNLGWKDYEIENKLQQKIGEIENLNYNISIKNQQYDTLKKVYIYNMYTILSKTTTQRIIYLNKCKIILMLCVKKTKK